MSLAPSGSPSHTRACTRVLAPIHALLPHPLCLSSWADPARRPPADARASILAFTSPRTGRNISLFFITYQISGIRHSSSKRTEPAQAKTAGPTSKCCLLIITAGKLFGDMVRAERNGLENSADISSVRKGGHTLRTSRREGQRPSNLTFQAAWAPAPALLSTPAVGASQRLWPSNTLLHSLTGGGRALESRSRATFWEDVACWIMPYTAPLPHSSAKGTVLSRETRQILQSRLVRTLKLSHMLEKYKAFYEFHESALDTLEEIVLSGLIKSFHLCGSTQWLGFFQKCSLGYLLLTLFSSKFQR